MAKRRRKTIVVCNACHDHIHLKLESREGRYLHLEIEYSHTRYKFQSQ